MILERLERLSDGLARITALAGLAGLMGIAALTCVDVLGRWLLQTPVRGAADITTILLPIVVGAAFPVVISSRGHIAVKFLSRVAGTRGSAALEAFGNCLALVALALVTWFFVGHAVRLAETGESTWIIRWPLWPTWFGFAVLLAISVAVQAIVVARDIANLVSGHAPKSASSTGEY